MVGELLVGDRERVSWAGDRDGMSWTGNMDKESGARFRNGEN